MSSPFNLYALKKPQQDAETQTRTFTDPNQPGVEVTLAIKPIVGFISEGNVETLRQDLLREYVQGEPDGKGGFVAPGPVMLPLFEPIVIKPWFCTAIAPLMVMHVPTPDFPKLDFKEWAGFAQSMPVAFNEIMKWTDPIWQNTNRDADAKNELAESTERQSVLESATTPPTTQE